MQPVIWFAGRELSYVLLTGILLCFLNTFLLLTKPSILVCTLQRFAGLLARVLVTMYCRFGVGLGFSVVYGALLTKTNRYCAPALL